MIMNFDDDDNDDVFSFCSATYSTYSILKRDASYLLRH